MKPLTFQCLVSHTLHTSCFLPSFLWFTVLATHFPKSKAWFFQWSSELASPSCHVIPDHVCLVQHGQRIREAQRHFQATSTCRTDASKAWAHLRAQGNTDSVVMEKTHLCRDWGCAVSVLLNPRMMPASIPHKYSAWWFHNRRSVSPSQSWPQHWPKHRMCHYQMVQVAIKSIKQK